MLTMSEREAKLLSPLNLAYIGDCVYELLTRCAVLEQGNMPVQKLHRASTAVVCAGAQSQAVQKIEALLSEEEAAIYRRGRNANGSHVPKNADPQEYRRATGLEALFGYLYLIGKYDRVRELYDCIRKEEE